MAAAASSSRILSPFRSLLRTSHQLADYNIRQYSKRTIVGGGKSQLDAKRSRFPKQHRGTMAGISGNHVSFGKYALRALEPAWITSRQIEAGRRAMIQNARHGRGKVWVRVFSHKSVTVKPTETRMGRGKGSIKHWVAVVKPGRILYEMGGVAENIAKTAISIASSKMPIQTRFITSSE